MSNKKKALIAGITGQDGSYLAELLINKGYEVVGFDSLNNYYDIKLKEAIIEVSKLSPKDKVRIHNKYYATVNTRNHIFRKYFLKILSYLSFTS